MTAPVQAKGIEGAAGATTLALTLDSPVTVGNTLWVNVRRPDTSTCTVADSLGNTYTSRGYVREAAINRGIEQFTAPITTGGTPTITATYNVSTTERGLAAVEQPGTYDADNEGTDTGGNPTATLNATATAQPGTALMFGVALQGGAITVGAGFTDGGLLWPGTIDNARFQYKAYAATGSQGGNFVNPSLDRAVYSIALFIDITAQLDLEGYRWGVDDANEAGHSWEAAQDTDIVIAASQARLLRVLINATDDPASFAFTLRYQKNGSGGYVALPIGSASTPALTYGATGTLNVSASGGTSVAPTYPTGITPNSCLVLVVGQKPTTANGGTVTTPSGWTLQGSLSGAGGYGATLGADTGNTNVFVYTKDTVTGSESGTLSVTVGDNNVCWANIYRIQASDICTWSYAFGSGSDTSAGNVSIATSAGVAIAAGDHVLAGMVIPTDVTTPAQFTAEALSQTSTTFGTVNEVEEPDSGTGNDIGGFVVEAGVSSGGASGTVTLTATAGGTTTNVRGPGFVLRVRATGVTNEVYVDASANIAAGGEATTARLTAPSGKTTSDFVTGRRWDNENGSDSIDITINDYTEVEWRIAIASSAVNGDFFDFRVYKGAQPLDTYTFTPRWTIGSGFDAAFMAAMNRPVPISRQLAQVAASGQTPPNRVIN